MIFDRWLSAKRWWNISGDILSVFGLVAVITTIAEFFPHLHVLTTLLKEGWAFNSLLIIAFAYGIFKNRPRHTFEYILKGKDIKIKLVVGDVLKQDGTYIVPVNNAFDMDLKGKVFKTKSIQSQVISNFFNGSPSYLRQEIASTLKKPIYRDQKESSGTYKMGTTVFVENNKQKFYFVANSVKTAGDRVEARKDDLLKVLAGLWSHLSQHGSKEDLIMPLIGTGSAKISMNRNEVFKEIVLSFIASCDEKSYCSQLILVITPNDVETWKINIDELNEFLLLNSKYHSTRNLGQTSSTGKPVL
jgi:hypothetical protein